MKNKKFKISLFSIFFLAFCALITAADRAVLVHNTRQDIEAVKGKLKLKLVRIWGGDEEEDENKFFKSPHHILVDKEGLIYINDIYSHHIKIFNQSGNYLRTIGGKGQGPSDLYHPLHMALTPDGGLAVREMGNRRIQFFDQKGKSTHVIKTNDAIGWFGFNKKNQLVVYGHHQTIQSRKLLGIWDNKGKVIDYIGEYLNKSDSYLSMEFHLFTMDAEGNIYAANRYAPVIRKYDPEGNMVMAMTFDPPFDIPIKVGLNARGNEIEITGQWPKREFKKKRGRNRISVQAKGKSRKIALCRQMAVDSQNRIYILTPTYVRFDSDGKNAISIISSPDFFKVLNKEAISTFTFDNIIILVFSPEGKAIASGSLKSFSDYWYISGNRFFVSDDCINQRILEFEISFEE
jgi:hypothetical protein